jgi:hypothetical protein
MLERIDEGMGDGKGGMFEGMMIPNYKEKMADVIAMLDK